MKPVLSPTAPSNWLVRQLAGPTQAPDGGVRLAPERQRRHGRVGLRQMQVESPLYGWVIDASEGGLRLESPSRLPAGGEFTFRLRHRARFFRLRGRVVWSRLHRIEDTVAGPLELFHTGVELLPGYDLAGWPRLLELASGTAIGA